MARRFLERRSELLQHRAHRAGAYHLDFCRAGCPGGKAGKQRQNGGE
jgi:hypothetical protein